MLSTCWRHAVGRLPLMAMTSAPERAGAEVSGLGTVLFQAWHDFDQVAGPVAVVELVAKNALPGILAGARRARQTEDVGASGQSAAGARLNGGGRHLLERDHVKDRGKTVDLLFEQRLHRLRR